MNGTKRKWLSLCMLPLLVALLVSGCGSKTTGTEPAKEDTTPVTLTLAGSDKLDDHILALLNQKFPYITIHQIQYGKGSQLSDLVSQGNTPDLVEGRSFEDITYWSDLGLAYDMTPLVQKYKLDLSRYNASFISSIYNKSPNRELYALPYFMFINILYYNKDLFDKFGVPYPKDGMTWPQIAELAKQVTRSDGGTQFRGLEPDYFGRLSRQYPLLFVDPQTDKAAVDTEQWAKFMTFLKSVYQIPGNLDPKRIGNGWDSFLKDRTLAMWPYGTDHWDVFTTAVQNGLNWDMVSYPQWPDAPGQGPSVQGTLYGISASSPYKEQAFKVLSYLGSDEVQTELAKGGFGPSITKTSVLDEYGIDMPLLKGKNTKALFVDSFATIPKQVSKYDSKGAGILNKYISDIVTDKKDINTALRDASSEIDQAIASAKQSGQ